MRRIAVACLGAALALVAGYAAAQERMAYTSAHVHLRAGPGPDYPVIAILPAGREIAVTGCLSDYSWCDVIAPPDRGWMYAAYITYPYEGRRVPLRDYGARIGIAVLGFALLDYWHDHYRDRPFYRERDRWAHRPRPVAPPVRQPPRREYDDRDVRRPPLGGGPGAQRPQPPRDRDDGPGGRPRDRDDGPGARPRDRDDGPGARPPREAAPRPQPPREGAGPRPRDDGPGGQRPSPPREGGPGKGPNR